jgi:hypothetical protein
MDVEVNGGKGRRMISPHQSGCKATSSHGHLDVSGLGHARHNSDWDVDMTGGGVSGRGAEGCSGPAPPGWVVVAWRLLYMQW